MHHKIVAEVRCACGKTVTYVFPAKLSRFFLLEVD
jgi:hypothetical protein